MKLLLGLLVLLLLLIFETVYELGEHLRMVEYGQKVG